MVEAEISKIAESAEEMAEKMREKFIGTLLGASVGDALGAPVEFMSAGAVARRYGTVREMIGGGPYNRRPGEYTDDTHMMLCIAESLIDKQRCFPADIARRFIVWYKSDPKDIGNTTKEALTRLCENGSLRHCAVEDKPTNGSIMRCAPLSLAFWHNDEALIGASMKVSAITHSHNEAKLSCAIINLMIAKLLMGAGKGAAYAHAVKKTGELDRLFVKKYINSSYAPEPGKGLAVNTLLLAISSFMPAESFEEAVVKAVNLGGDADTTGAVTGALAGAYFGRPGIPRRWSAKLNPKPADYFVRLGSAFFETKIK